MQVVACCQIHIYLPISCLHCPAAANVYQTVTAVPKLAYTARKHSFFEIWLQFKHCHCYGLYPIEYGEFFDQCNLTTELHNIQHVQLVLNDILWILGV